MKAYAFIAILAVAIATAVYTVGASFLAEEWQGTMLMFSVIGAYFVGLVRWVFAIIDDPRDLFDLK